MDDTDQISKKKGKREKEKKERSPGVSFINIYAGGFCTKVSASRSFSLVMFW